MSANKEKGTKHETSMLPLAREWWPEAHRAPLAGIGDLLLPGNELFTWEIKNWSRMELKAWTEQAEAQAVRHGVPHGIVTHKRRGVSDPRMQWMTVPAGTFFDLLYAVEQGARWRPRRSCAECGSELFRQSTIDGDPVWMCMSGGCGGVG